MPGIRLRRRRLLLGACCLLVLRLPLLVRHPVHDLPCVRIGEPNPLRLRRLAIPPAQAVPAESRPDSSCRCSAHPSVRAGAPPDGGTPPPPARSASLDHLRCGHRNLLIPLPHNMACLASLRHTAAAGTEDAQRMVWDDGRARAALRLCSTQRWRRPTRARCWPRTCPTSRGAAASSLAAANPPRSWPPRWKTPGLTST